MKVVWGLRGALWSSLTYDNSGVYRLKFWIENFSYVGLIDRHGKTRKPIYCDIKNPTFINPTDAHNYKI